MKTMLETQKLERLSQKDIIRFFNMLMEQAEQNPSKFANPIIIGKVTINDKDLMTTIEIELLVLTERKQKDIYDKYIYRDYHAIDYSCANLSISPVK
jgi:hypothetical protein